MQSVFTPGGSATGASHGNGLGAAIVAGLDVELDLLTLAQAAVAVGLDAGLRQTETTVRHTKGHAANIHDEDPEFGELRDARGRGRMPCLTRGRASIDFSGAYDTVTALLIQMRAENRHPLKGVAVWIISRSALGTKSTPRGARSSPTRKCAQRQCCSLPAPRPEAAGTGGDPLSRDRIARSLERTGRATQSAARYTLIDALRRLPRMRCHWGVNGR